MLSQLRPAIVMVALFTLLLGVAYPFAVTGAALKGARDQPRRMSMLGHDVWMIRWLAFILSAGFWAVCLLAPLLAWMEWRKDREPTAWAAMAAPLAWGAATVAMLQFVPT